MKPSVQYRRRRVHFIVALVAASLVTLLMRGAALPTVLGAAIGSLAGYAAGRDAWRRLRRQIDGRNMAVMYVEDGVLYARLVAVYLLSLSPMALAALVLQQPGAVAVAVISISFGCAAYTWVLYRSVRDHEGRFGPLRVRTFYARSIVGPESFIGRIGRVVEACNPDGRVKVDAELWGARSQDGTALAAGTPVKICDIEGLRLRTPSGGRSP